MVGPDAEAFFLTRDWEQTVQDVLLAGFEGDTLRLWQPTPAALTRLAEVVALTELEPLLERDFRMLSHGQRRRVVLARALMPRPEALLLDEFTDGLSAGARQTLGRVLERILRGGCGRGPGNPQTRGSPRLPWRTVRIADGQVRHEDAQAQSGLWAAQAVQGQATPFSSPFPPAPAT